MRSNWVALDEGVWIKETNKEDGANREELL